MKRQNLYPANICTAFDQHPFGMLMPERSYSSGGYRYGFNSQEKDDEVAGSGNINTAEYWEYDCRLGRRWNMDPKSVKLTCPYSTFGNNPLRYLDSKGDTLRLAKGQTAEFTNLATDALNKIKSTKLGASLIKELESSEQVFEIRNASAKDVAKNEFIPNYIQTYNLQTKKHDVIANGGVIVWDVDGGKTPVQSDPKSIFSTTENSGIFALGHEIGHAYDQANNKLYSLTQQKKGGLDLAEWSACHTENILRNELKAPLRTHYNVNETQTKGVAPELLKLSSKGIESRYVKGYYYTIFKK